MGRHGPSTACLLASLLGLITGAAGGQVPPAGPVDPDQAMRLSQAAIGQTVGDHWLIDTGGRPFELAQLRGRPFIISYIYTSCAFVCPTLTSRLAAVVDVAREALGAASFAVVTVGFDTAVDTPERMGRYAAERGIAVPGWHFLSGDPVTVKQLAREIGFAYAPAAGGFDHLAQVTIVDGNGRIYGQVYGPDFEPPMIVDPLKRLALGITTPERPLADFLNKVRLLCTSYDPKSGRYRFDYSLLLEIAIGLSCTIGIAAFVLHAWRQARPSSVPRS